ncbi:MAG: PocR ligand-binding domain-containing protein [Desulfovibrionaceae bacterium]|nr:PocR ligand-binding domain-containing protein [Desulfovibrionaceae bacterium]
MNELTLQNFCDISQLYALLDNWSKSTGISAVIVDRDGRRTSESFGMTEFCAMVHASEKGMAYCQSTWKKQHVGVYECPMGFYDFAIDITLPDGRNLGKVLAGQACAQEQDEEKILGNAVALGIDREKARAALARMSRKTLDEIDTSYALLKEILNFFIEKNYSVWKANRELSRAPAKQDRILSQITKIMYSYNLTVDLETGAYSLITGTGMERTVAEYSRHENFAELKDFHDSIVHPAYLKRFLALLDFRAAQERASEDGFCGTLEYPILYPGQEEFEWHEVNVFIGTDAKGVRVANILGRDITAAHNAQERSERELRAAAAKNKILSELTKMLYSYNLTLNLRTGKYSMIVGTGMTKFMEIFKSTDDYETAYHEKIQYIAPEDAIQFAGIASLGALRVRANANGFIGNLEYGAITDHGNEWHEINIFISTNEFGEPVANILGRDITEAHKRQEQRKIAQKAAIARDQLLSGVTKMLYSYNLTVNLETWKYSLITGTGMKSMVQLLADNDDYIILSAKLSHKMKGSDMGQLRSLIGVRALQEKKDESGFAGSVSCEVIFNGVSEWHEVNLFIGTNEEGVPVAHILGRDITGAHKAQERRENELKAAAAKDQILSNITKTLYSYNVTLNLNSGKYSLIVGTGMERFVQIFASTDDYETAYGKKVGFVTDDYVDAFSDFSSLAALRGRMHEKGYLGNLEYAVRTDQGQEWHEINVFIGTDENGEPIANILGRDVTEAHDKADTKAQLEIANAANAAKSTFLFNMSHDIRTPMNAIMGFTNLLEKHLDNKEKARSYIKKIQTSNAFLLSLINNVLEMAKIESGKSAVDEIYWNVVQFNDSLCSIFESQMLEKNIEFTRTIQVEHSEVLCDETKLREIFLNLLSNALKYTPAGGRVCMRLTELPSDKPGYALYRTVVEDSGIGISAAFLPHMFEEFTRERTSTESKVHGTGLGMPIVKKLVELLGGTIEVESQIGRGTKFTVTLPHKIAPRKNAGQHAAEDSRCCAGQFTDRRILLAEDNDLNAEIAITVLEEAGFSVERAADGIACVDMLEKAEAGYYDLILMDILMPNMDGYKATRTIRGMADVRKSGIPIIAMTANAFEEDRRNAIQAGMNGHLAKPIVISELMGAVSSALSRKG